ncbi:MAG TPA: ABC transporter permease subunit [Terriglobia bacterium]|nr:ABC transporter permease subunit [Terriglobia bacterium]
MFRPGIFIDTFQESFRNKMFLFFFVISSLVIATIGLALNMDIVSGVMQGVNILGNELQFDRKVTVAQFITNIQTGVAMLIAVIGMFLALMATSTLFAQMLQRGSIELLLCRPIPRWRIMTARFLGGATIMAFNAVYLIVGVWFVLGLKSGVWTRGFPISSILVIFAFVVLFSIVLLVSVITENGPAGLLAAYTVFMFSPVLAAQQQITPVLSRELYRVIFRTLYWIVPKSAETIGAMRRLIAERPLDIGWVVGTSSAFALLCYVATMVYFTRKDY